MKLNMLLIRRVTYGENEGRYTGEATFDGKTSKIELAITPVKANEILRLCADGLLDAATESATATRSDILNSVALIEHRVDPDMEVEDESGN